MVSLSKATVSLIHPERHTEYGFHAADGQSTIYVRPDRFESVIATYQDHTLVTRRAVAWSIASDWIHSALRTVNGSRMGCTVTFV